MTVSIGRMMVEPATADDAFEQGEQVLLIKKMNSVFLAIRNTNDALIDKPIEE
jgi:hypothetical protein